MMEMTDVNNLCRACLETLADVDDPIGLAKQDLFLDEDASKKFTLCTSLEVDAQDGLPRSLCGACCEKLTELYQFRLMCTNSVERFQELLHLNASLEENGVSDFEADATVEITIEKSEAVIPEEAASEVCIDFAISEDHLEEDTDSDEQLSAQQNTTVIKPYERHKPAALVFRCDTCPKRFLVKERLLEHKRGHGEVIPYACAHAGCDKSFNRWYLLCEHLRQHESVASSSSSSNHTRPMSVLIHSTPDATPKITNNAHLKNFDCPHCSKRQMTRSELKSHIQSHTLYRTWPCHFCTQILSSANTLKKHEYNMHCKEKPTALRSRKTLQRQRSQTTPPALKEQTVKGAKRTAISAKDRAAAPKPASNRYRD